MNKKILLIPVLAVSFLTGCGGPTADQICSDAIAHTVLLMRRNGRDLEPRETVHYAEQNESFLGLSTLNYQNKYDLNLEWMMSPADRWESTTYKKDTDWTKFKPVYIEGESYQSSLTLIVSTQNGKGSATATWNFEVDPYVAPDLSEFTYASAETIITTYASNPNAPLVASGSKIYTYGIVTAKVGNPFRGLWIGDGNYGVMLYGTADGISEELEIGDKVLVAGTSSPYNGTYEINVQTNAHIIGASSADPLASAVTEPVTLNGNELDWSNNASAYAHQGSLVRLSGVTYVSGTFEEAGASVNAVSIVVKLGNLEITVYLGKSEFPAGDLRDEMREVVNAFTANETVLDITGVIGQYNGKPQIIPAFGADSFTVQENE